MGRGTADAVRCGDASQGLRWTQASVDGHMFPRLRLQVRVTSGTVSSSQACAVLMVRTYVVVTTRFTAPVMLGRGRQHS